MSFKPVLILSADLPLGLKTNFAAVLGMSLGQLRSDLIGAETRTGDGVALAGITRVALPVLGAPAADLPAFFAAAGDLPVRLAYMRAAFEAKDYDDYAARIAAAPLDGHAPQAILLGGPRKAVDRICGRLPLLR
ncbi:DUF2000 domain-containing protein [Celeribacter indicus]|uniref:DUF2000 domain-containing protein n=1 Tax=Celeribacter indicus TaxID=1208324 RepID=A0A0B5E043_9RHOB|nr:DUF2000 domain-containing protein [Celeribacter indicus]AJE45822.1 hypothetical protein P73_1107 [Celeribacter indicus]SDW61498.1 Protein of unknown function [Celeribacter indicus]